jgi:hypothetical protein
VFIVLADWTKHTGRTVQLVVAILAMIARAVLIVVRETLTLLIYCRMQMKVKAPQQLAAAAAAQ